MAHIFLKFQYSTLHKNRIINVSLYKSLVINFINSDDFRKYEKVTKIPPYLRKHTRPAVLLQILVDVFNSELVSFAAFKRRSSRLKGRNRSNSSFYDHHIISSTKFGPQDQKL